MPATPTYPGVYIEELPSSVRTITAVSTSVTAFVGFTTRGPVGTPVVLTSFADYERRFGGLAAGSVLGNSVQQFFLNGGSTAVALRIAGANTKAADATVPGNLTLSAGEPGVWGNRLLVRVDYDTTTTDPTFNLQVSDPTGRVAETYRNLSVDPNSPQYVMSVVNAASRLIRVDSVGSDRPEPSGTVSTDDLTVPLAHPDVEITAQAGGGQSATFTLFDAAHDGSAPGTITALALLLQRKLRAAAAKVPAFAGATVKVVGKRLQVFSGDPAGELTFGSGADELHLPNTGNPSWYTFAHGADGDAPMPADFEGDAQLKTGLNALRDVADLNLLCLPEVADMDRGAMTDVLAAAVKLCEDKRMLLIVDPPADWGSLDNIMGNITELDNIRSNHAALYVPRIEMADPLTGRLRSFPPSGAVAGIMARTDAERGVWKAPAGTEAKLAGVQALTVPLTDPENGLLNPLGVNCLRTFPIVGTVVWGARTLEGADALASQWKYVPVRRLALMIEESLYRGTKWVVFEPNGERLWGQIRLNVGAFMQTLFRQGAFAGTSAREAYFVKCDKDTTTQNDIDSGKVNILVGFAPLKPAEFVIVQIEQLAGQIEV